MFGCLSLCLSGFSLFKALPISPGWVPLWGLLNLQVSLYAYLTLWGLWEALRRTLQKQWPLQGAGKTRVARHALSLAPRSAQGRRDGGGCGGASAQRPGDEPDAPGPPCCRSLGDAPQDSRRLWERTSAVAGAAGARPPPRTARRPEGRVRREDRRPATFPTSPPCGHRRGSRALREAPAGGSP